MRIAIIGTGGVGGYFGARLHDAGEDVTFIARGAHLEAIEKNGLQIFSALGDTCIKNATFTDNPESIAPVDIVIIAVKLWATEEAILAAKPLLGDKTGIISLQNGILAEEILQNVYGLQHAMGGVSNIAALIESPGVIRHNGTMASLYFGELDASNSARVSDFYDACERANINAQIPDDINVSIWEKFIRLVTMSSMTALCRMPIGLIRSTPETRDMLSQVLSEVIAVATSKGMKFAPNVIVEQMKIIDGYPPTMVASMCGDLRRGYRLELPWLAGTVSKLGKQLNIPTPTLDFVYASLKLYENGRPDEAQI